MKPAELLRLFWFDLTEKWADVVKYSMLKIGRLDAI